MSNKPNDQQEKKIIVDEDWKSRVQAEKEEQQEKQEEKRRAPEEPLPPPTLGFLASSLGMQAMIALGVLANPVSEKTEMHLDQAKHFIDTIEMLREKTEGNRTPDETVTIDSLLHELRMTYVAVQSKAG